MHKVNKIALVDHALAGEDVERVPFSVWHHFPENAKGGKACAEAHIAHYRMHDLDYLKVMNDNAYDMPSSMPVVNLPKDWLKLEALRGDEPGFRSALDAIHEIKRAIGAEVRFVITVFSPFAVAMKISRDRAVEHLRDDPESFDAGLAAVARGLAAFSRKAVEAGASGIFLAASGAEPALLSEQEYRRFVRPHDIAVLSEVKDAPFNILHVHGSSVYLELFLDYPKSALNWPSHHSAYPMSKVRKLTDRCLVAGIDERGPLAQGKMRGTIAQMNEALAQAGRTNFMFGSECTIPPETPVELVTAIRDLAAQM
jgi:uroporphyrinogen decarboxylase